MFINILFNYRGEQTHFSGERTQGECEVRANGPDTSHSVQIYKFAVTLFSTQVKFSLLLELSLFLSFLCILTLNTIALSITFTLKRRLFARKERLAKRNKTTIISLWSRGRAISADIGQELCPLRLVW